MDGGLNAQTIRLEGNIDSRAVDGSGSIDRDSGHECVGVCLGECFSGQFSTVKARFPRRGAAVRSCELAWLSWPAINLARLSPPVTGKGNVWSQRSGWREGAGWISIRRTLTRSFSHSAGRTPANFPHGLGGRALDAGRPRNPHPCRALVTRRVRTGSTRESDSGIAQQAFGRSFRRRR
jgi:hypothetical protein